MSQSKSHNSSVCWFPDRVTTGAQNDPQFVPCDPSATHSACCAVNESCVGKGLCYSSQGTIYRGGCTDKTWSSPACPANCITAQDGPNAGRQDLYQFLTSCGGSDFVCSNQSACANPQLVLHSLLPGQITHVNITGNVSTSTTSCSSDSSVAPAAPLSPVTSGANTDLVVGAGVGVPLGVALLLALAWGFWERKRRLAQSRYTDVRKANSNYGYGKKTAHSEIGADEVQSERRPPPQELM